jgi:Arc/MetJ-type ribon-helix-helix transcriptional regulator
MATTTLLFKLDYPPEIEAFVAEQLAAGCFDSESELATAAIRYVKELIERDRKLRADLKRSIEQADRGEVAPLNMQDVIAELDAEWKAGNGSH